MAVATALTASSWPTMRLCSSSARPSSRSRSLLTSLLMGMPVHCRTNKTIPFHHVYSIVRFRACTLLYWFFERCYLLALPRCRLYRLCLACMQLLFSLNQFSHSMPIQILTVCKTTQDLTSTSGTSKRSNSRHATHDRERGSPHASPAAQPTRCAKSTNCNMR